MAAWVRRRMESEGVGVGEWEGVCRFEDEEGEGEGGCNLSTPHTTSPVEQV